MIDRIMTAALGASWKPTVMGMISAIAVFVAASPDMFPHGMVAVAKYITVGGIAGLGIASKGANVTGGTTPNDTNNPLVVASTTK